MENKLKILFVEDLPTDVELAKRTLTKEGIKFQSHIVENETDFVRELNKFIPDIIISDYMMPAFNGMRALKITLETYPNTPFILLTGSMNEEVAVECMKAGAVDYIIKEHIKRLPFAIKEALKQKEIRIARGEAERALQESELRYRTVLQQSLEAIYLYDVETKRVLEANPTFLNLLGYNAEEVSLLTLYDIVAHDRASIDAYLQHILSSEGIPLGERLWRRKDGTTVHVEVTANRVKQGDKTIAFFVARDITERKLAEKELRESESRFRLLYERAPVAYQSLDSEGRILEINDAWLKQLGYRYEEVIGHSISEFLVPDHIKLLQERFPKFLATGEVHNAEFDFVRKDGKIITVSVEGRIGHDKHGEFKQTHCILHNITERKRAEEELKKKNTFIQTVLDNLPIGIALNEIDKGNALYINKKFEEIYGWPKDEMKDIPEFFEKVYPDKKYREELITKIMADIQSGDPSRMHWEDSIVKHKDGSTHIVNAVNIPLFEQNTMVSTVLDITERKRAEEALRRLNRELHAISNCNQTLLRALDEQTLPNKICRIICDEAGYRMAWVGYAEHDETKTVRPVAWAGFDSGYIANAKITWADDTELGRGPAGKAIRSGEMICVQDFTTDPQMVPWRESALQHGYRSGIALPLKDENTKVFGVLLIYSAETNVITPDEIRLMEELASDLAFGITALRTRAKRDQMEEALLESEEKFRNLASSAQDSIVMMDDEGKFFYWNEAFKKLFQYKSSEITGKVVHALIAPKRFHDDYKKGFAKYLETGEGSAIGKALELAAIKKNGDEFPIELSLSPLMLKGKRMSLGILRDITERKRSEKELIEAKERAEESDKLKSEFLAQMSHEIRTPINAIVGNVDFLNDLFDESMDADSRDCFDGIGLASKRIIRTVDLILNVAELQTSGYKPQFVKVDLNSEVLNKLYKEHQLSAKQKGLEFIYTCKEKDTKVIADEYSITQIFANLIDNAIKYTKKGKVEILLGKNKTGNIMVEIKDTGIGMSKEFLPRIFDPFVQEDHGYTRSYDGSGLGLTLVKNYCDINNAVLEVESEKNVGSTFRIIFSK
ncbi:MAG: PAS domain S-box protein [Ignavibacteriales bacterium]|nr:PAS domain S-box protein [Ignavibacteriales bacterium]